MSSLYIDRKGIELRLSGETLVCYENNERVGTIPLAPIDHIYLRGDVTLKASLLAKLGEKNIGIIFLKGRKNTPTLFLSQPHNDVIRRFTQYDLAYNEIFCLNFAKSLINLKINTQKIWLYQAAEHKPEKRYILTMKATELKALMEKIATQNTLAELRGIEGKAAAVYFSALSSYLPPSLGFEGRNRRPPKDPFNAVLSLTYTLLHSEAILVAYGAGLDPYIGFYHSINYSRESLACDLIEPLRPLVDNWILGCFHQEILRKEHFSNTQEGCFLGKTGRINFYQEYEKIIVTWRKILTENCYDLVNILKGINLTALPQRRLIQQSEIDKIQLEEIITQRIETYYFNQQTMLSNIQFNF
ncbi:CRISPR-associated Cas1 family protein [Bisgaardia hudsonensis]|uniref:CRISPR-associated endonuclease Cas1 n=1 Tax=Bisgaardia hudsonensis TaxID=109472 RepID=A0A4R2N0Z9_9PAST|nr:CRISPR-associated endonuclease Cas1 [Bisgaardia hudsonensis]QLB13191.1 CRISPR-associated endonuclease Cas1 [Bisgaardia hudsonensis]TCP13232.1 CRISPR-associated Cas1 family protein [Bisgaardia hudsonensis]